MRIEESAATIQPVLVGQPVSPGLVAKVRKITKHGNSYYIALPQEFIKKYHFKPGDRVAVLSDTIVKVIPMQEI
jgi:hypothetical protein